MAAERDQQAAERAERTERSTLDPRLNLYKMVYHVRSCGSAKELD